MALPIKDQAKYWGLAIAIFVALMWFMGDVILPFVIGGAIAYFLDPVADRLEAMGLGRTLSVTLISLIAVLAFLVVLLPTISLLAAQATQLAQTWPELIAGLQDWFAETFPALMDESSVVRVKIAEYLQTLSDSAGELLGTFVSSAFGIVNALVLLIIVPVVAFYLLLDWDRMIARVDALLPRDHADTLRALFREIDNTLASFIRGQGTVMLVQGAFYAIALMLAGLNFGLIVGLVAGLLSFIPYVGAIVGGGLAMGLALFQFWGAGDVATDWVSIAIIAAIFIAGQIIEGNFLTPKLVGSSVGLHPVWLIFALSLFGTLFGFVGLLVAVPVAAMIGVLTRFAIGHYEGSLLYYGHAGPPPDIQPDPEVDLEQKPAPTSEQSDT